MRYTLRQLEVFLATAHFENVSRAADHLSMSQSAASGALKELESQFEIKLFELTTSLKSMMELGGKSIALMVLQTLALLAIAIIAVSTDYI